MEIIKTAAGQGLIKMSESKKIVKYKKATVIYIAAGMSAMVETVDHPDCSNKKYVVTSCVLKHDPKSGVFETLNTLYVPVEANNEQYH
jgi:hypothetical protein